MSFGVLQQVSANTVIDACIVSNFTSAASTNLILQHGDRSPNPPTLPLSTKLRRQARPLVMLVCYEVSKVGKLFFEFDVRLAGRPEAICSFRPQSGADTAQDHLALLFRDSHYISILKYDAELGASLIAWLIQ
eukprot:6464340-Amphidinium_carterae.1